VERLRAHNLEQKRFLASLLPQAQGADGAHGAFITLVHPDATALAACIGCGAATLSETLAGTRLAPPYFAVRVTGALFHTQGGLDIDADTRVLHASGVPMPNLLAAGGAARGVSGGAIWGYLSGNGLLSAVAGGAIAARTAEQQLRGDN